MLPPTPHAWAGVSLQNRQQLDSSKISREELQIHANLLGNRHVRSFLPCPPLSHQKCQPSWTHRFMLYPSINRPHWVKLCRPAAPREAQLVGTIVHRVDEHVCPKVACSWSLSLPQSRVPPRNLWLKKQDKFWNELKSPISLHPCAWVHITILAKVSATPASRFITFSL